MRTTFRRILEEEVRAAGIQEARIVAAKLSYDESRMVPFERDESGEIAAFAAWRKSAFATSIELGPDGRTLDFLIAQLADWDGSARLRTLFHELVRKHCWAAQDPRSWPSHLEHAADLPWRVVLECRTPPDATIEAAIDKETRHLPNLWGPAVKSTGTFVVIRPEDPQLKPRNP
jgi:hypothetical protein